MGVFNEAVWPDATIGDFPSENCHGDEYEIYIFPTLSPVAQVYVRARQAQSLVRRYIKSPSFEECLAAAQARKYRTARQGTEGDKIDRENVGA